MSISTLESEICAQLQQLPIEQQRHVLEFVRALVAARVRGVPGQALLRFAGAIEANDRVLPAALREI